MEELVKKWAKIGLFCVFISFFSQCKDHYNTINDKSVDGVLGTRTRGGRMEGAGECTELWWYPNPNDGRTCFLKYLDLLNTVGLT